MKVVDRASICNWVPLILLISDLKKWMRDMSASAVKTVDDLAAIQGRNDGYRTTRMNENKNVTLVWESCKSENHEICDDDGELNGMWMDTDYRKWPDCTRAQHNGPRTEESWFTVAL